MVPTHEPTGVSALRAPSSVLSFVIVLCDSMVELRMDS